MADHLRTLKAAWPLLTRAALSGQLFRPRCELVEPDPDIECDYDVGVPIDGGIVLTANAFRARKAQR